MTIFNLLQAALAAAALALWVVRARVVLFRAPLATNVFVEAVEPAWRGGHLELVERLASACRPAWAARLVAAAVLARARGADLERELYECRSELAIEGVKGIEPLLSLGRIAGPLAFIGVIVEIGRSFSADGLVALQRGLAESRGLERAALTFSIGVSTSLFCFTAAALLRKHARGLGRDLATVEGLLLHRQGQGAPR